ncbi:MAG TPA: preprotein translocase subunit YajC [Candidatus Azoamicus sp.]
MIKIILLLTCPFTVYANQPDSDLSGGLSSILLFIGLFAIMYFVIIRPQTKKAKEHKTLIDTIKINDEIVTNSGIVGKIEKITEQFVIIEICNNTTIIIRKEFISTIIPKGTIKNIK